MKIHILGSGTSSGVPVIGCSCPVCTSTDSRNKRTRTSIAVELDSGHFFCIDTSPEFRLQMINAGISRIEAVLYTHMHADHTAGFDDLRAFYFHNPSPIKCYLLEEHRKEFLGRFSYAFENTGYLGAVPMLDLQPILESSFEVCGAEIEPIRLPHGHVTTCGFRIGKFIYATDFKKFTDEQIEMYRGKVDVMVASGIHFGTHKTHSVIDETIQLFQNLDVKHGYITHLAHDVDHSRDRKKLPENIQFCFDGLIIDV